MTSQADMNINTYIYISMIVNLNPQQAPSFFFLFREDAADILTSVEWPDLSGSAWVFRLVARFKKTNPKT